MVYRVDVGRHHFTAQQPFARPNPAYELYMRDRKDGQGGGGGMPTPDRFRDEYVHAWTADIEATDNAAIDELILTRHVDPKGNPMVERVFACYLDVQTWDGNEYVATILKPRTPRNKVVEADLGDVEYEQLPIRTDSPYRVVSDQIVIRDGEFTLQIGAKGGKPVEFVIDKVEPLPAEITIGKRTYYNHQINDVVGESQSDTWRVVDWTRPSGSAAYKYLCEIQGDDGVVSHRWVAYDDVSFNGEWVQGTKAVVGSYVTLNDLPYPHTFMQGAKGVVREVTKGNVHVLLYPFSPSTSVEKAEPSAVKVKPAHILVLNFVGEDGKMDTTSKLKLEPPPPSGRIKKADVPEVLVNVPEPEEPKEWTALDRDPATVRFKEGDTVVMDLEQDYSENGSFPDSLKPFDKNTWWGTVGPHPPEADALPVAFYDFDKDEQIFATVPKLYLEHEEDWLPSGFKAHKWVPAEPPRSSPGPRTPDTTVYREPGGRVGGLPEHPYPEARKRVATQDRPPDYLKGIDEGDSVVKYFVGPNYEPGSPSAYKTFPKGSLVKVYMGKNVPMAMGVVLNTVEDQKEEDGVLVRIGSDDYLVDQVDVDLDDDPSASPPRTRSSAKGKAPMVPRAPRPPPPPKQPRELSSLSFESGEAVRLDFKEDFGREFPKHLEMFKGQTMYGTVVPHTHSATAPNLRVCIAMSLDRPDYNIFCASVPKIYIYHTKKLPANFEPLGDKFFEELLEDGDTRTPSPPPPEPGPSKKRKPRTFPPPRSPSKRRQTKPASPPPPSPPPSKTKPVPDSPFTALLRRHNLEVPGTEEYDKARLRATEEIPPKKKACGKGAAVPTYTYPSASCRKGNKYRNRRYGPACKTFTKCVSQGTATKHKNSERK